MSEAAALAQARTEQVVRAHPLTAVVLVLGGGILLGALAARLFAHKTTLSEAVHERLGIKRRIARAIQGWL